MSFLVIVATLVAVLAFARPLRVVALPLVHGIQCPQPNICIDNLARLSDAQTLYQTGYKRAEVAVGAFQHAPRVVFCTTLACADEFGLGKRAAETLGTFGLVVAPRGWKSYYMAHEFIHYRQAESLGNLALVTKPKWFIEGMAYSMSDDPRYPLASPFEQWRAQFNVWHASISSRDIWVAAQDVH